MITDTTTSFIWITSLFEEVFKHGGSAQFLFYVGTNTEQICVKYCNFVQCRILVNCLSFYVSVRPLASPLNKFWTNW
jgi:hypothetical protein